ncbi:MULTISPECIES: hypothetical protein [unclassified Methylophaga]|uniref:hypothetical protein n=1 Tax=unclassified Methylophaga TaxID=2629249 RepID=UPI000C4F2F0D|nr:MULTISPECIES: hypothetical protein [unclassified Methylophaga]MAL49946.1 hypothetical protein [Methylophaga sp.]MBP24822.1 hypothetical protein [Methylophaga sp.]
MNKSQKIDLYLQRLSHITQFFLFLFTVLGFYFVVLPIYQKDVLQESIAKKELELEKVNESLLQSYSTIRNYTVRRFITSAGAKCSGLLIPIPILSSYRESKGELINLTEKILNIESTKCLTESFDAVDDMQLLNTIDYLYFQDKVAVISRKLDKERLILLNEYNELEKLSIDKMERSLSKYDRETLLDLEGMGASKDELNHYENQMIRRNASDGLSDKFSELVRNEIDGLKDLSWP